MEISSSKPHLFRQQVSLFFSGEVLGPLFPDEFVKENTKSSSRKTIFGNIWPLDISYSLFLFGCPLWGSSQDLDTWYPNHGDLLYIIPKTSGQRFQMGRTTHGWNTWGFDPFTTYYKWDDPPGGGGGSPHFHTVPHDPILKGTKRITMLANYLLVTWIFRNSVSKMCRISPEKIYKQADVFTKIWSRSRFFNGMILQELDTWHFHPLNHSTVQVLPAPVTTDSHRMVTCGWTSSTHGTCSWRSHYRLTHSLGVKPNKNERRALRSDKKQPQL